MSETAKREPYPVINKKECKACERCIIACPLELLEMSRDTNTRGYHYAVYKGEGCNACGNCYYTCPEPLAVEVHIPSRQKTKKTPESPVSENKKLTKEKSTSEVE
jgi:2-oxoisovalerate ferredoxin oxidoreductase delta subunit